MDTAVGAIAGDVNPGEGALHTLRPFGTFRNKMPSSHSLQGLLHRLRAVRIVDLMARVGRDVIEHGLSAVSGWAATGSKSIPARIVARVHGGSLILQSWTVGQKIHSST